MEERAVSALLFAAAVLGVSLAFFFAVVLVLGLILTQLP